MSRAGRTTNESYDAVDVTYRPETTAWSENPKPATVAAALDALTVRVAGTQGVKGDTGAAGAAGSATAYAPADASKWAGTPPATIAEALDRLALLMGSGAAIPELP